MEKTKITTPDPLASFEDKLKESYGNKIAQFISQEWFSGKTIGNGCEYMGRKKWIENKRLYARGEQDLKQYKSIVARQTEDLRYLNLDWRPINVCEKFCNSVINGISDENYKVNIRAIDRYSMLDKMNKINEHRKNMLSMPALIKAKQVLGIDMIPKSFVPEEEEDLTFYSEIKDKPKIEIGEEILINYIKNVNNWKNIKEKCDKDIVEIGLMGCQIYTDPINGVSARYIDPENAVHSYVNKNDFSDAFYFGHVEKITLSDIKRESGLDDIKLREIAKAYSTGFGNIEDYASCPMEDIIDRKVDVLRFCWKTSKTIVFKKYIKNDKAIKVARRDEKYIVPPGAEKSKIERTYDTWLEGNHVIGTNIVYGYKECENIVKDELNKVMPPFIFRASAIYKNRLHSFLSNIEPLCDQMQYVHLKIQHLMAELKPDILSLDIDELADLSSDTKGENKQHNWKTALAILNVKGVVLRKRVDMGEMGIKDGDAARPMPMQQGSALGALLNLWAHYYNQLREITGINPARDGSLPANALLGVNQMAQLASNTITKHITEAAIDFDKKVCETISSRVKSIFKHKGGENIIETYKRAVGKQNIEAMESMADRHLHDFGFVIEVVPSNEEINNFKEDLAIAMKEGTIDVEVKIEAEQLSKTNMKLATEYLKYMRRKRIKQMQEEKQNVIKAQTEGNIQSTQASTQAKVQSYSLQKKIDLDFESKMAEIRVAEKQAVNQIEAPIKDKEFEQEVFLERIKSASTFDTKKYLEEAKNARIDKQNSQQSELLEQRKNNSGPIDFENKNFSFDDNVI